MAVTMAQDAVLGALCPVEAAALAALHTAEPLGWLL